MASGEYRAPLLWIERGYQTFPLYLRRIWGTGFIDAGDAFQGPFHPHELKVDAGVEAHLELRELRPGGEPRLGGPPDPALLLGPDHVERIAPAVPVGGWQSALLRHGGQLLSLY